MAANRIFDNILEQIQSSNLNFHIQVSPFSAVISLKKSLVKDRSGNLLLPPASPQKPLVDDVAVLVTKNLRLEKDMMILQKNYEEEVNNCEAAYEPINCLQGQSCVESDRVQIESSKATIKDLEFEIQQLKKEKEGFESVIKNKNNIIDQLEMSNQQLDHLRTENEELNSKLLVGKLEEEALKKEINTKDDIIQNLNKVYTLKVHGMKLEIAELNKYKQKRVKEEKEATKKEKKLLKKKKQKARKEDEKQIT